MAAAAFCYRHPAQIARRYCYQCERSICRDCQVKLDHHLFCGERCHQEYLDEASLGTKNSVVKYAMYAALVFVLGLLVYFGLLADAFYSGSNHQSAPSLKSIALSLPINVEEKVVSPITISHPRNGEQIPLKQIYIDGIAPENSEVSLYLNGILLEKTTAHAAQYRFADVQLTKRANVIQTRYYVDGSSEASTPIMIFSKDSQH
jgi:hypothetical protein